MKPDGVFTQRIARELALATRVWIAPELDALAQFANAERGDVDVALVACSALAANGDARVRSVPPPAQRVLGVLCPPLCIVDRLPNAADTIRICRGFSELGVFDVHPEGLVIIELAQGVSAIDVQQHAQPTLKISSRIRLMRDNVAPPEPRNNRDEAR